ncbi:MAG: hypothetical protein N4A63_12905 [Vallitalea sp.]|jgi:hypothetical protein|nr:hypothetical protein [Vallitalea sp.]
MISKIIEELTKSVKTVFPTYKNYLSRLPEKASYPCFLYEIGLSRNKIENYFTQKKTLNIDIIYFNSRDIYTTENFLQKLETINKLEKEILSKYYLEVNNKKLSFNYDITENDGQSLINLKFIMYTKNYVETDNCEEEMKEVIIERKR